MYVVGDRGVEVICMLEERRKRNVANELGANSGRMQRSLAFIYARTGD